MKQRIKHRSITVLLTLFMFSIGQVCGAGPEESQVPLTDTERAWLIAHPQIKLGAPSSYPPFVIKADNGAYTGMLVELYELINQQLNTRIRLHIEDSWESIQQKAGRGEIDGLALGGRDSKREVYSNATDPAFSTYYYVFARAGDEFRLKDLGDLAGLRVGHKKGAQPAMSMLETYPRITPVPYKDNLAMTKGLLGKEVDVLLSWLSYEHWRRDALQGTVEKILLIDDHPVEMCIHIRKDWPELTNILNKTLAAVRRDGLPQIMDRWFIQRPRAPTVAEAPLTREEQTWLEAHPDIRFALSSDFPPTLIVGENGQLSGIMKDLMDLLNQQLGTDFRIVVRDFETVHEMVRTKKVAGQLATAKGIDQLRIVESDPVFTMFPVIYGRAGDGITLDTLKDLEGRRVAVLKEAYALNVLLEPYQGRFHVVRADSSFTALKWLFEGKVDLMVGFSQHKYLIEKNHLTGLIPLLLLEDHPTDVSIGVRDDWPELVAILNKGIGSLSRDELYAVSAKWIDYPDAEAAGIQLTQIERDWLDRHRNIRLGADGYWPPFEYFDTAGTFQGLSSSYVQMIRERLGVNLVPSRSMTFGAVMKKTRAGEIDILTAAMASEDRLQFLNFSKPHTILPIVVLMRDDASYAKGVEDLQERRIATIKGYITEELLLSDFPGFDYLRFDTIDEALLALSRREADAFIGNTASISYTSQKLGLDNLRVVAPTDYRFELAFGVRKDWPELIPILNKFIDSISSLEKRAIEQSWLNLRVQRETDWSTVIRWASVTGGGLILLLGVALAWNRKLAREVAGRRAAEASLEKAKAAAEAASHAKSLFLSHMSHELRTPLNAILGFSDLLLKDTDRANRTEEVAGIIHRSGHHLMGLINDILDISRIESGQYGLHNTAIDLRLLIQDTAEIFDHKALGADLHFIIEEDPDIPEHITADEGRLRQVLSNLLDNAVKFTHKGSITFRAKRSKGTQGEMVRFEVEDTGSGISEANLGKVFEPFIQVGSDVARGSGIGLGLAISQQIVSLMGGTLSVKSDLGKGSLFAFEIPVGDTTPETVAEGMPSRQIVGLAADQPQYRILIADDDRDGRILLKRILKGVGFDVREASDGRECCEVYAEWRPDFIWMDMRMPVMDGYAAVSRIRRSSGGNTVKIVALTASAFEEQRDDILGSGCDDVVIKPFESREIFAAMETHLGVRFQYATDARELSPTGTATARSESLSRLPGDTLMQLMQSVKGLDTEAAMALIDRIGGINAELAEVLRGHVRALDWDILLKAIEAAERGEHGDG